MRISSVSESFQILVICARQKIEERVEASIQRPSKLRNRSVEGMERQAGGGTVGELQRPFLDAFECAFGNETNAVDEGVASHDCILPVEWVERVG